MENHYTHFSVLRMISFVVVSKFKYNTCFFIILYYNYFNNFAPMDLNR